MTMTNSAWLAVASLAPVLLLMNSCKPHQYRELGERGQPRFAVLREDGILTAWGHHCEVTTYQNVQIVRCDEFSIVYRRQDADNPPNH